MKPLRITLALAFAALLGAAPGFAECIWFDGINHCPLGAAQLQLDSQGAWLAATNLGDQGNDGVASLLDQAVFWNARTSNMGLDNGDRLTWAAHADGKMISRMRYRVVPGGIEAQVDFTGADGIFGILLDDDDSDEEPPIDGPGGLVPGTTIFIELIDPLDRLPEIEEDTDTGFANDGNDDPFPDLEGSVNAIRSGVKVVSTTGACYWTARFAGRVRVWVDGVLAGEAERVYFVEDVSGPGHYPYTQFDALTMRSSGSAIVVREELQISNGF